MRCALEETCWLWLGCWSNNVANSHLRPGPLHSRVLHSCLVPQCLHPPHWLHHQRCLANCDWMPASYISRQPSNPCRNPIYRASSHHIVSSTPCHGTWASAPLSAHPSIECRCTAPQIKTPNCTHHTRTHQFIWQHTCGALGGSPMEHRVGKQPYKTPHFHLLLTLISV